MLAQVASTEINLHFAPSQSLQLQLNRSTLCHCLGKVRWFDILLITNILTYSNPPRKSFICEFCGLRRAISTDCRSRPEFAVATKTGDFFYCKQLRMRFWTDPKMCQISGLGGQLFRNLDPQVGRSR